ncbi:MAG: tyrosine-type recombinase/integrase, partial [Candidatus Pacearchaeota archaeon]
KKICFDSKGAYFLVDGKTGTRRVRVVNSTPFLHAWLNVHPNKNEDNAPLWVNIGTTQNIIDNLKDRNNNNNYKMQWKYCMSYAAARKLLQVAAQKAGIKKPINPHNFRHSRATKLCSLGISGNILNEYFGWTQASRSVSTYLHLSGKQVDDTLLNKAYGMPIQETKEQPKMFPLKCYSCGHLNEPNVSRCVRCNSLIGQISNDDLEEQKTISQILKIFGGMIDKNKDVKTEFIEELKKEIMAEIRLSSQKEKIRCKEV